MPAAATANRRALDRAEVDAGVESDVAAERVDAEPVGAGQGGAGDGEGEQPLEGWGIRLADLGPGDALGQHRVTRRWLSGEERSDQGVAVRHGAEVARGVIDVGLGGIDCCLGRLDRRDDLIRRAFGRCDAERLLCASARRV